MARNRIDVFEALADTTRRRILELLRGRELAAGEIAGQFALQRPGISKHLTMLKGAGLLEERRDRQRRIYRLRQEALDGAVEWLSGLRPPGGEAPRAESPDVVAVGPEVPAILETRRAPAVAIEATSPARQMPRFELEFD